MTAESADAQDEISAVNVVVRVRPFQEGKVTRRNRRTLKKPTSIVQAVSSDPNGNSSQQSNAANASNDDSKVVTDAIVVKGDMGVQHTFKFDMTFSESSTQKEIFHYSVKPLLKSCIDGYNATVLAYGQTGSGKTYSMCGPPRFQNSYGYGTTSLGDEDDNLAKSGQAGIIPRALRELFLQLEAERSSSTSTSQTHREASPTNALSNTNSSSGTLTNSNYRYQVRVQFIEVYGEDMRDLLSDNMGKVHIRDNGQDSDVKVVGATTIKVTSAQHAMNYFTRGLQRRVTAATHMNLASSRSHAIMTVYVDQTTAVHNPSSTLLKKCDVSNRGHEETKRSKFHFVDLAGSERLSKDSDGLNEMKQRNKEGIDINKGLLALGNVISALGDPKKSKKSFVPYRDSKLTRLLKGSLGGDHKTLMIACVSPSSSNMEETLNCLRYAARATKIENHSRVNVDFTPNPIDLELLQKLNAPDVTRLNRSVSERNVPASSHKTRDNSASPQVKKQLASAKDHIKLLEFKLAQQEANGDSNTSEAAKLLAKKEEEKEFYRMQVLECKLQIEQLRSDLRQKNDISVPSLQLTSNSESSGVSLSNSNESADQSLHNNSEKLAASKDCSPISSSELSSGTTEYQSSNSSNSHRSPPSTPKIDPPEDFGKAMLDLCLEMPDNYSRVGSPVLLHIDGDSQGEQHPGASMKADPPEEQKNVEVTLQLHRLKNDSVSSIHQPSTVISSFDTLSNKSNNKTSEKSRDAEYDSDDDSLDALLQSPGKRSSATTPVAMNNEAHASKPVGPVNDEMLQQNRNGKQHELNQDQYAVGSESSTPIIVASKTGSTIDPNNQPVSNQKQPLSHRDEKKDTVADQTIVCLSPRSSESVSQLSVPFLLEENPNKTGSVASNLDGDIKNTSIINNFTFEERSTDSQRLEHDMAESIDDMKLLEYVPITPTFSSTKFLDDAMSMESDDDLREDDEFKDSEVYAIAKKYTEISKAYSEFNSMFGTITTSVSQESGLTLGEEGEAEGSILGMSSDSDYSCLVSPANSPSSQASEMLSHDEANRTELHSTSLCSPTHKNSEETIDVVARQASLLMEGYRDMTQGDELVSSHDTIYSESLASSVEYSEHEMLSDDEKENDQENENEKAELLSSKLQLMNAQPSSLSKTNYDSGVISGSGLSQYILLSDKMKKTQYHSNRVNSRGFHYR